LAKTRRKKIQQVNVRLFSYENFIIEVLHKFLNYIIVYNSSSISLQFIHNLIIVKDVTIEMVL